jgi:hypothetical protein
MSTKKLDEPLGAPDHTRILELVLINRERLPDRGAGLSARKALKRIGALKGLGKEDVVLLRRGVDAVERFEKDAGLVKLEPDAGRAVLAILGRIARSTSIGELVIVTYQESKNALNPESLRIGCKVAHDFLLDGSRTVYSPEAWVVYQAVGRPDAYASGLFQGLKDAFSQIADAVIGVAKDDAKGAVGGALGGAAAGGMAGGVGAGPGAAAGAVGGGIANSVESVL